MSTKTMLNEALIVAGLGQILLVLASLAVPRLLGWKRALSASKPLTRQIFWVHALYLWATQLFFGLVSACAPGWLTEPTPLAAALAAFLSVYWASRLIVQLFYYDQLEGAPQGWVFRGAELGMTFLFLYLAIVYATVTVLGVWSLVA